MARGKFNKRGGGKRVDAQSASEIEQRNERLAEFEERRSQRRADAAEEEAGGGGDDKEEEDKDKEKGKKAKDPVEATPAQVTTEAEHRRNMAKLEAVRKRREQAEKRRLVEEEAEKAQEEERMAQAKALQEDDSDDDGKKKKKKGKAQEIPKLSKIEIKKMKPALLKEALKERGLEIQGNAKALTARLLEYEEKR